MVGKKCYFVEPGDQAVTPPVELSNELAGESQGVSVSPARGCGGPEGKNCTFIWR